MVGKVIHIKRGELETIDDGLCFPLPDPESIMELYEAKIERMKEVARHEGRLEGFHAAWENKDDNPNLDWREAFKRWENTK